MPKSNVKLSKVADLSDNKFKPSPTFNIELKWLVLSLILGYFYAGYIISFEFINSISNTAYLSDDMWQHFLGWNLFRYDQWFWPLTLTQRLQYPLPTSIVFTDSLPLLTIFLKLLSPVLPKIFVWDGILAIINSALQFYLASKIFRSISSDLCFVLIGSLFLLFSSAMCNRFFNHYPLTSHWLILWSLYLILKPNYSKSDFRQNLIIIFLACGIHFYILSMCLALSAALFYKIGIKTKEWKTIIGIEIPLLLFVLWVSFYLYGYFTLVGSHGNGGWTLYSTNLNSFINPEKYSLFFPGLPLIDSQGRESFQYLGIGVIIAGICAIINVVWLYPQYLKWQSIKISPFLLLIPISIFLCIFSLSTKIYLGSSLLFDITPWFTGSIWYSLFPAFRASGRMSWPVFYLLTITALLGCYNLLTHLKGKRFAHIIMSGLLILQIVELIPLRNEIHASIIANSKRPAWDAQFTNPWWQNLGNYKNIILLMNYNDTGNSPYPAYFTFGMLASKYGLTMNQFYLARGSSQNVYQQIQDFARGNWDSDGVYIVDSKLIEQIKQYNPSVLQYCKIIDDFNVCTKYWN